MAKITKPPLLNETGQDIAAALWGLNAILRDRSELSFRQMKDIIDSGGGSKMFPVGTTFLTTKGNYVYPWTFVHHGQLEDGRPYADIRVSKAVDLLQIDSPEAFFYCETALPAGPYYFEIGTDYGEAKAGKYKFTLPQVVPAGGRLAGLDAVYSKSGGVTACSVKVYDTPASLTASQTVAITSGSSGTKLCVINPTGDPDNENANSIHRAAYGSNNYAQSAIHQYLNSDKAAGTFWAPTNRFDNAPSWQASQPGFMSKLPDDFLEIVSPVDISTITNNIFETDGYTTSSSYSMRATFWLPSRFQIFGSTEGTDLNEKQWDYYKGAVDMDRIMYDKNGTARNQWLRSPSPGHAGSVRIVNTSGAVNSATAGNSHAVAPACRIYARKAAG
ncbi:MAG: hypothetical protein IJV46_06830 [Acidaminococcaceae bacterium]|nr:hypothetical protein [Acidaminococcaceae bacterium]